MEIKETLQNYVRILTIAKKPDKAKFLDTLRTCSMGVALVGSIGFIFYFISALIGGL